MFHSIVCTLLLLTGNPPVLSELRAAGQGEPAIQAPAPQVPFHVPSFPNVSCPIMGKPASTKLFTDTDSGRIYICCKRCVKDIQAAPAVAYRSAYPADTKVDNKVCPVSGAQITKDSPTVTLQGFTFFVAGPADVAKAREQSQAILAKLHDPKLVDLRNTTCPVSGAAVERNNIVVIDGTIVHLSSGKQLEEVAKDPLRILKQAQAIRAKELSDVGAQKPGESTPK